MKPARLIPILLAGMLLAGCGHKEGDSHGHGKESHGKEDSHGHKEESPSGGSFKANKGVLLIDETRKILGVEVAEVVEQKLPAQIRFNLQIFGEKHHHAIMQDDHTGCDVHGSGFLPADKAAHVRAGLPVQIQLSQAETLAGVVLGTERPLALGEAEILVGVTNASNKLKPGEFLSATITQPREQEVLVIPRQALLRTSEGTFVYAVNGDAYLRTAIKIGTEADGLLEVTDGLLAGDSVVTKPVETLWLIELRATKGGGHSH